MTQEIHPLQLVMFMSSARRKATSQPAFSHSIKACLTITSQLLIFLPKEIPNTFFAIVFAPFFQQKAAVNCKLLQYELYSEALYRGFDMVTSVYSSRVIRNQQR
jgi:hypothetical protein